MAEWWESDPVVETASAPTAEGDWWKNDPIAEPSSSTRGAPEIQAADFEAWKRQYAPNDSGEDYDLRAAFEAGVTPDPKTGHWPDTFKRPNHPTFSNESIYAKDAPALAGKWAGDKFIPPAPQFTMADFMSGDRFKTEDERRAAWKTFRAGGGKVPLASEAGAIPAKVIEPVIRYGTPLGWAQMASEAIQPGNTAAKATEGVITGYSEALSGFTTPEGLSQLAIMPQSKIGQIVLNLGFGGKALSEVPEQVKAYGATDDPTEKAKIATNIAVSLGLPAIGLKHGLSRAAEVPKPRPPESDVPFASSDNPAMARFKEPSEIKAARDAEIASYLRNKPSLPTGPRSKADEIADYLRGEQPQPTRVAPRQGESAGLTEVLEENEPSIGVVPEPSDAIETQPEPPTTEQNLTDLRGRGQAVEQPQFSEALPAEEYQRQHEEQLRSEAQAAQAESGNELLEAIAKSGGLPAKNSPRSGEHAGELSELHEAAQNPHRKEPVQYNKIFRRDAPSIDELATRLRDHGFAVETPSDVFDLVSERLRTEKPLYGTPALAESLHGEARVAEKREQGLLFRRQEEEEAGNFADIRREENQGDQGRPVEAAPRSLREVSRQAIERDRFVKEKQRTLAGAIRSKAAEESLSGLRSAEARDFARETLNRYADDVESGKGPPDPTSKLQFPIYRKPTTPGMVAGAEYARSASIAAQSETGISRADTLHGEGGHRFLPGARERGAVLVPDIKLPEGVKDVAANIGEAGKAFFGPSKFTPFREVLNKWVGGRQVATLRGAKILRAINREVPNKARQRGITIFREAGGNRDLIRGQLASARTGWFRQAANEALRLMPEEIRTAEKLDEWYDRKGRRALSEGAITAMRDNYVNHVWNRPERITRTFPQPDSGGGKLNPSFRPGKERVLPTLFDGDRLRLTPKTIAAGELAAIYNHSLERAITDRHFVSDLLATKTADGKPVAISQQEAARLTKAGDESFRDYKPVRHWAFRGEDYRGDILVHPQHARHVEAAIRPSTIDRPEAAATPAGALARRAVRGTMRVSGLVKQNLLSLPGFHYAQEGVEGVGHFVNPLSIERIDPANPVHRDAMDHGLMVASTHGGEAQWMEGLQTSQALITKVPIVGPAIRNASHYLFEHYIPSLKIQTYKAALNRNIRRLGKELESGKMTLDDVKYHTARQVNDAYGHLNYADMGRSENMQKLTRLLLLAPDFLEARGRQAASGIAGLVPGRSWRLHAEQRVAFWTLAAGFYISARALNQYLNGNPDWRLSHAFSVTHNGREYTLRSVPEDVLRFMTDTRRFALARLNPLTLRTGLEAATGLNYRGQKVTAGEQLRDFLSQIIPLGLKDAAARLPGLEKTGNEDVSLLENFAKSLGVGIKRASPVFDAHSIAREWMKAKGMPADTGTYPSSPYARLRNALEDNNAEAAKSAYQSLLRDKNAPDIIKGFRLSLTKPFTKNEATDKAMLRELSANDRATILRAQQVRKTILQRFGSMRQSATAHVMEQEAAKRRAKIVR